jgi:hypothetical protein
LDLEPISRPDWYESFLKYPIPVPARYARGKKKTLKKSDTQIRLVCSNVNTISRLVKSYPQYREGI